MATPSTAATALRSALGASTRAVLVTVVPTAEDLDPSAASTLRSRALSNQSEMAKATEPQMAASAWSTLAGPGSSTERQADSLTDMSCRQSIASRASPEPVRASPRVRGAESG
ncbi:MAG TPA: hypothetical protein VLL08_32440 [Kineosporiaceae bacterium]|nr:hypothetical protein [Kineosporiaceae bacterium]